MYEAPIKLVECISTYYMGLHSLAVATGLTNNIVVSGYVLVYMYKKGHNSITHKK